MVRPEPELDEDEAPTEDALGPKPKTVPPVRVGGALVMDPEMGKKK